MKYSSKELQVLISRASLNDEPPETCKTQIRNAVKQVTARPPKCFPAETIALLDLFRVSCQKKIIANETIATFPLDWILDCLGDNRLTCNAKRTAAKNLMRVFTASRKTSHDSTVKASLRRRCIDILNILRSCGDTLVQVQLTEVLHRTERIKTKLRGVLNNSELSAFKAISSKRFLSTVRPFLNAINQSQPIPFSVRCKAVEVCGKTYEGDQLWMDFNQEHLCLILGETFQDFVYHQIDKCQAHAESGSIELFVKGKIMVKASVLWTAALPSILEQHLFVSRESKDVDTNPVSVSSLQNRQRQTAKGGCGLQNNEASQKISAATDGKQGAPRASETPALALDNVDRLPVGLEKNRDDVALFDEFVNLSPSTEFAKRSDIENPADGSKPVQHESPKRCAYSKRETEENHGTDSAKGVSEEPRRSEAAPLRVYRLPLEIPSRKQAVFSPQMHDAPESSSDFEVVASSSWEEQPTSRGRKRAPGAGSNKIPQAKKRRGRPPKPVPRKTKEAVPMDPVAKRVRKSVIRTRAAVRNGEKRKVQVRGTPEAISPEKGFSEESDDVYPEDTARATSYKPCFKSKPENERCSDRTVMVKTGLVEDSRSKSAKEAGGCSNRPHRTDLGGSSRGGRLSPSKEIVVVEERQADKSIEQSLELSIKRSVRQRPSPSGSHCGPSMHARRGPTQNFEVYDSPYSSPSIRPTSKRIPSDAAETEKGVLPAPTVFQAPDSCNNADKRKGVLTKNAQVQGTSEVSLRSQEQKKPRTPSGTEGHCRADKSLCADAGAQKADEHNISHVSGPGTLRGSLKPDVVVAAEPSRFTRSFLIARQRPSETFKTPTGVLKVPDVGTWARSHKHALMGYGSGVLARGQLPTPLTGGTGTPAPRDQLLAQGVHGFFSNLSSRVTMHVLDAERQIQESASRHRSDFTARMNKRAQELEEETKQHMRKRVKRMEARFREKTKSWARQVQGLKTVLSVNYRSGGDWTIRNMQVKGERVNR